VIAVRQSTHCGQQDEMIKAGMEINGELLLLLQAWRSMTCDIIANDVAVRLGSDASKTKPFSRTQAVPAVPSHSHRRNLTRHQGC